jgi:hypothetical protein
MNLTLKLRNQRDDRTFIVGCKSVDVVPYAMGYNVKIIDSEGTSAVFGVGPESEFDIAYVESFNGATSHIIKRREHS